MKKISYRIRNTREFGFFHDSRADVRKLAEICNDLIDTVNDLIDEVQTLKEKISQENSNKN